MTKELKSKVFIPENYKSNLSLLETEIAIKKVKDFFENKLAETLNLTRVSAPLFLENSSGLNDNLNGIERPVSFDMLAIKDSEIEIVHSLAKWKRFALHRYNFQPGYGLYTDMNAIRRDEELDNLHSIYVDQWDWEKVITKEERTVDTLKSTVKKIFSVFKATEDFVSKQYPSIEEKILPQEITFITSQELEDLYPNLTPKERENAICKKYKAVFIQGIGDILKSGGKVYLYTKGFIHSKVIIIDDKIKEWLISFHWHDHIHVFDCISAINHTYEWAERIPVSDCMIPKVILNPKDSVSIEESIYLKRRYDSDPIT